jgi:protein-S-isoprenylcysteine O-methyltransferase Ste14
MELLFKTVLGSYFVLFISIALFHRSYLLYKKTGINALAQTSDDRTLKILAIILKIHLFAAVSLVVDYIFKLNIISVNRFQWIPNLISGSIGSLVLIFCLYFIIRAQQQMQTSWRLEVDLNHPAKLITEGLFNYSRNPIFMALRLSYFALFLIIPCPFSLIILIIGDLAFQFQVQKEELYLHQVYSDEYTNYCLHVPRWL